MVFGVMGLGLVLSFVKRDIKKRRKTYPSRTEFTNFINVPYIDDNNYHHTYDVYLADKSNRKNCCFIDIHGGAYVFGDHEDNYPYAYELLKAGYDVVLLDYDPNNGEKDILDIVNDCVKNIQHLVDNLDKYGLTNDIFVMSGDSAGGHLALLLSLAMQNKNVANKIGISLPELPLIATVIACPVYDYAYSGEGSMTRVALKRMKGPKYRDFEYLKRYNSNTYINENKLPLFVSTSNHDFLRSETLALNKDMKGKPGYKLVDIKTDNKEADHVHNVVKPHLEESKKVNNAIIEFVDKLLK